jgi:S1-C subfamily serine protease
MMSNVDDAGHEPIVSTPPPPSAAWPPPPPPLAPLPVARPRRQQRPRALATLAVAFFLALSTFFGYELGSNHDSASSASSSSVVQETPSTQGSDGSQVPSAGQSGRSGSTTNFNPTAIASAVIPTVVNINSSLENGAAAGTGIVISADGLVLTNNHVIAQSTALEVAIGGDDNNTHPAKVLGYDVADDVALIKIEGVSGLQTASIGNSSSLSVGDPIVAVGNAGGRGGTPSVVTGTVTALEQQITASDPDGSNSETLSNLVQVNANIVPGDSGGPLVDTNSKVVGMNSAAASGAGGFGFGGSSSSEGYAIPIEDALAIAKKIDSGDGGNNIHIGATRAVLGVQVQSSLALGNGRFGGSSGSDTSGQGATVVGVQADSGAAAAGIAQGDVITAINGNRVGSASELTHAIVAFSPKDKVDVEWVDQSGQSHRASVVLGSGPPA